MSSDSDEILIDLTPFIIVYKDGRVERLSGEDFVPPGVDGATGVKSKDVEISSNVSARLYLPKNARSGHKLPLLVYIHGGGFVSQKAFNSIYHRHMNDLAAEAKVIIVSVDYRRPPEHPLPAAYGHCWLALQWIASHYKHGSLDSWLKNYANFNKVYFGGDSAGANLVHHMVLKADILKLEGLNVVGFFLNCPFFWGKDPIGKESSRPDVQKLFNALWPFAYPKTTGLDDPLLNPAKDPNLSRLGCKRILIFVAGNDVLKDRGLYYKQTLTNVISNTDIQVVEFEGEGHVFNLNNPDSEDAKSMLRNMASFMNQIN